MQWGHRQPKIITNVNPSWRWMNWQVYDSDNISPTLTTNKWEGIKIITRPHWFCKWSIRNDWISPTIRRQVDGNILVCEQRSDEWLRFFKNNICWSLRTIDSCWDKRVIRDWSIRKLTPLECSRLQDFPDDWFFWFWLSNSQIYKQCWNAIPVWVVRRLFLSLFVDKEHTWNILKDPR